MSIPSIDKLVESVQDPRTKENVNEVLSCFYSNNLRSAIVMLYSTVMADLYYKICDLDNLYKDNGAKQIKNDLEKEWSTNQTSPNWETSFPKKLFKLNKILTTSSYTHLEALRNERHLCAHPALDNGDLHRPNASTVRGFIIDMLDGILCRPSFLSKDFINKLTDEISDCMNENKDMQATKNIISKKYLSKIKDKRELYNIFKLLWKLVFKNDDDECTKNRKVNRLILSHLYECNKAYFNEEIKSHSDLFSGLVNLNIENGYWYENTCLYEFILFLNKHIDIFKLLTDDFRMRLEGIIKANDALSVIALFLQEKPIDYILSINTSTSYSNTRYLYSYLKVNEPNSQKAIDFAIRMYGASNCFDLANELFDSLIKPNIGNMSVFQLEEIIKQSDKNSQIYSRRNASNARDIIIQKMKEINPSFNFDEYSNFMLSI